MVLAVWLRDVIFGPRPETTINYKRIDEIAKEQACFEHMQRTGEVPVDCRQYDYTR